jgi:hypothetical protein
MNFSAKPTHTIYSNFESHEDDEDYLSDERCNLDCRVGGRIIALASLGLWNGRKTGYKLLDNNISSILSADTDYAMWYGGGRNIYGKFTHHDGTNYVLYRVVREDKNIDILLKEIYNDTGNIDNALINRYTKSLYPYVANIYGWS